MIILLLLSSRLDKSLLNQTHGNSLKFYNLLNPSILDYVEDLIGPNFVLWGGQFFLKDFDAIVPWHQDANIGHLAQ